MLNPYILTFVKVADCGSFSAACESLFLSKVSVMNQINALEKTVGVPLFQRTHQGVQLTDAGKSFYKNCIKIMRLSDNALQEARQAGGANRQIIRIGASMMRPCNDLIETLDAGGNANAEYIFHIVPFNDEADSLNTMLKSLGDKIDCFVSPCGSMELLMNYSFLPVSTCRCAIAMSRKNPLAKLEKLKLNDLHGQTLLLLKRGNSYVLDALRDDIIQNHPSIQIADAETYYDISSFNLCEQNGYMMETLGIWSGLHPSLKTTPVDWKYEMPYGIIYAKHPSEKVRRFIAAVAPKLENKATVPHT